MHTSPLQGFSPPFSSSEDRARALRDYYEAHNALLSRADFEYMTMADGRQSSMGGAYVYEERPAEVTLSVGGSLAKVTPAGPLPGSGNAEPGRAPGDIVGFSTHSRRRLMRLIASTERSNRPLFVTLTYPDRFDQDKVKWKRDMDVFGKRFSRAFPDSGFLWRIEFKERLSGVNAGQIAPHFHLLVWDVPITNFRDFADMAWYSIVGSADKRHRKAGVSSERVRQWGGTMAYVAKYIAKIEAFPLDWSGRVWGVVGRERIPWAVMITIEISDVAGIKLTRLARKMMGLKGRVLPFGVTFLLNTERVLDYLEWLEGFT